MHWFRDIRRIVTNNLKTSDMKIKCQEHYENTVKYAKSIGDETLSKCIERLKQWEVNSNGRYETDYPESNQRSKDVTERE